MSSLITNHMLSVPGTAVPSAPGASRSLGQFLAAGTLAMLARPLRSARLPHTQVRASARPVRDALPDTPQPAVVGSLVYRFADGSWIGSPAFESMSGLAEGEGRDPQRLLRLLDQRDLVRFRRSMNAAYRSGSPFDYARLRIHRKDGATRWVHVQARVIGAAGRPAMLLCTVRDLGAGDGVPAAEAAAVRREATRVLPRFDDPASMAAEATRLALARDLRVALAGGQFELYYQPQVDAAGRVHGAEALLRWHHPRRGLVAPGEFIPLCETTGLILPLGRWVLDTACAQLAAWSHDPQLRALTLSVNVSACQFNRPEFVDQVQAALRNSGVDASRLELELTEGTLLDNTEGVIATMRALKTAGVRLSLDDFGTGYSSLAYLKRLPIDQLKIDQTFVRDLLTDASDLAIVRTILALGESFGIGIIAEGVETEAQRALLASAGCALFQGYLFGRPLPPAGFEQAMRSRPARENPIAWP